MITIIILVQSATRNGNPFVKERPSRKQLTPLIHLQGKCGRQRNEAQHCRLNSRSLSGADTRGRID